MDWIKDHWKEIVNFLILVLNGLLTTCSQM